MQARRGENDDVTALGRWAVGPSVNISFPEHISESTCPIVGGLVVPFGVYELWPTFNTHFVSGADLEKYWADYSHIAHTCYLSSQGVKLENYDVAKHF